MEDTRYKTLGLKELGLENNEIFEIKIKKDISICSGNPCGCRFDLMYLRNKNGNRKGCRYLANL